MKIFWSWQSDRDPKLHHYFVRDALKEACKLIAVDPEYNEAARPEVDHDTKNIPGTPDITKTILEKIAAANVFVADMTPVGMTDPEALQSKLPPEKRSEPKYLQNPNVMSELGYAERAISPGRIILVANGAHYPGPVALPFDWRHRSGAKVYTLKDGATKTEIKAQQKRFAEILKSCILLILAEQAPVKAPPAPISWQTASDSDPSIWKAAETGIQFRNNGMGGRLKRAQLRPGPRIFARIAPSEWPIPTRAELERRIASIGLNIRGLAGDWGLNGDGALSVWGRVIGDSDDIEVMNATQWFQKNGELWAVNSNCFSAHRGSMTFAYQTPFKPLDQFLHQSLTAIKELGGAGPIGIKLGAGDLSGTILPGANEFERYEAVDASVSVQGERDTWTVAERRALLFSFWNALKDAYGLPHAPSIEAFAWDVGQPGLAESA